VVPYFRQVIWLMQPIGLTRQENLFQARITSMPYQPGSKISIALKLGGPVFKQRMEYPSSDWTIYGERPDDSPYELMWKGLDKPIFPYDLKKLREANGNYELLTHTPFGDDLLAAFAEAALKGENLGKGDQNRFSYPFIFFSRYDRPQHGT